VTFASVTSPNGGCLSNCSGTVTWVDQIAPSNGRASHLFANCIGTGFNVGATYIWNVNGLDTTLRCTLAGAPPQSCSDVTHEINYNAGDTVYLHQDGRTGTGVECAVTMMISAFGSTTINHDSIVHFGKVFSNTGNSRCAQTSFAGIGCALGASAGGWFRAPSSGGKFSALGCTHDAAMLSGRSYTYTARNETSGFDSDMSVTCADGGRASSSTACINPYCTFSAGDKITINETYAVGQLMARGLWLEAHGVPQVSTSGDALSTSLLKACAPNLPCSTNVGSDGKPLAERATRATRVQKLQVDTSANVGGNLVVDVCTGSTNSVTCSGGLRCTITSGAKHCENFSDAVDIAEGDYYNVQYTDQPLSAFPNTHYLAYSIELAEVPPPTPTVTRTPTPTPTAPPPCTPIPGHCCDCGPDNQCKDPLCGDACPTPCIKCVDNCYCWPVLPTGTPTQTRTVTPTATSTPTQTPTPADGCCACDDVGDGYDQCFDAQPWTCEACGTSIVVHFESGVACGEGCGGTWPTSTPTRTPTQTVTDTPTATVTP